MTADDLGRLEQFFEAYTCRFQDADGALPAMQELKVVHSRHVAADAARIMQAEGWDEVRGLPGLASALLHDIGRFPQYATFHTFEDHKSINHAARGVQVLRDERMLDGLDAAEQQAILTAVGLHNVRELPADLPADTAELVHLVRDADKLDIFRVFEEAVSSGQLERHPEIMWSLDRHGRATPELVAAISERKTVSYNLIHSLCDFVMIQVGWLHGQFHFDSALRLAAARGALEFRERLVRGMDDSPAVCRCFEVTRAAIRARLQGA